MIAIREAWQQAVGRKAHSIRDLSRLCARVFRDNRYAAGITTSRTLAAGFEGRAERKPFLRIDGTLESCLCSVS